MKKINVKVMLVLLICVLFLAGCSKVSRYKADSSEDESMFVCVEETYGWTVVFHKDTKVMYVVSNGTYNDGTFTLLVDSQGKPMLWEEK